MDSHSNDKQADVINDFNSICHLLNIDSSYFVGMVNQICPPELVK